MLKNTSLYLLPVVGITILGLSSCANQDPEYKAWKAKQQATANNNPYGAPAAGTNPYGAPQPGGEAGTYTPTTPSSSAPYQPIPGVAQPSATTPYTPSPTAPTVGGGSHTVVAGDSLWGLAKRYGTSVEAIQSANGLTNTVIRTGQTLTIPGN